MMDSLASFTALSWPWYGRECCLEALSKLYVIKLIYFLSKMEYLVKGVLFSAYLYIHANYCLVCCHFSSTRLCNAHKKWLQRQPNMATFFLQYRLPWDSPLTWVIAAFAIDFCYYWVHRSAHGKSFLLVVLFMIVYWLYYLCITCYLFWVRR